MTFTAASKSSCLDIHDLSVRWYHGDEDGDGGEEADNLRLHSAFVWMFAEEEVWEFVVDCWMWIMIGDGFAVLDFMRYSYRPQSKANIVCKDFFVERTRQAVHAVWYVVS